MQYCVYAHALSCTEHMSRKRIWSLKWQTKTKKKKLAIYRSWPWISNCWEWDSNSGLAGIEPRALTTRPRRLGANLRRDATSRLLFLNQSVLADFDDRKKKTTGFKTRSLSGTSKKKKFQEQFSQNFGLSAVSRCTNPNSRTENEPDNSYRATILKEWCIGIKFNNVE